MLKSTNLLLRILFVFLLFLWQCPQAIAQTQQKLSVTIKGQVTDEQSKPVIGAAVVVLGTTIGTTTDATGSFSVSGNIAAADILQVSFMGMTSQRLPIGTTRTFNVVLQEDAAQIESVVVTGFQSISKTTFTGSASKVNISDINIKGATDLS